MINDPKYKSIVLDNFKKQIDKIKDYSKKMGLKNIDFKNTDFIKNGFKNINLRIALTGFMIISLIALSIVGYKANQIRLKAFDVYLGEDKIGTIRQQEDVLSIINGLKTELSNTYNMDIVLKKDIKFKEIQAKNEMITASTDIEKEIKSKMSFLVEGYILKVNGIEVGALRTKAEIEDIIRRIEAPYKETLEEGLDIKEIRIVENIEIVKEEIPIYRIGNADELYNHLLTSSEEIKTHTVEVGESLWTIAKIYNLSVDELIEANQDRNPDKLQIGDEIKLIVPKAVLTVATVAEVEYTERVKYESQIEYNDKMYKNEKKTKVAGVSGLAKIVANEIKHNGILVDREIVKEEILEKPITEIIIKGTKEVPKTVATGLFLMPTRGKVSSRYGMRNGRMHRGLDIASSKGTAINAADGGKVIFAGYKGAYGNMVEIDHGNGYKTRYAHASKILVTVGTKVYKGQQIANMGSTGRSTGSHLHFEVIKNGSNQNPANFIK